MNAKAPHRILVALCLTFMGISANAQPSSPAAPFVAKPAVVPPKSAVNYGRLPLSFEPNMGQTSKEVQWLAHGPEYTLFLAGHDAVLELNKVAPVRPGKWKRQRSPLWRSA
jgi:hypothetical protein